jgi:hypothetical protein
MTATPMQSDPLPIGTRVKTADGKNLGEIKEIRSDHYVVEKGLIFEEDFFIPLNAIVAVEGDTALIGLNEADLAGAGWEEPPVYEGVGDLAFQEGNVNPVTPDPFGVIATPRDRGFGENVAEPGEPPAVVDGTGNVSRVATTEDLSSPSQPVTDMNVPKQIDREVRPGEVWQDESIAEIVPGAVEPGRVGRAGGASYQAGMSTGEAFPADTTPAATPRHAADAGMDASPTGGVPAMNRSEDIGSQPDVTVPELTFTVDTPVYSADDEHIGDVVNVSDAYVMVEKSRFFGDRNFTIPKTAFHNLRGGKLYLNVPAVALETAGWDTGRFSDADNDGGLPIIPVPPRNLGGTGW